MAAQPRHKLSVDLPVETEGLYDWSKKVQQRADHPSLGNHGVTEGDPIGEEMSANAKVWQTYVDEASSADKTMVEGLETGLDVLLIFAGLFSAVVTAFVIEAYKLLQQDPNALPNNLLFDIASSLQEISGRNTSLTVLPLPFPLSNLSLASPTSFSPPASAIWINGLWFSSLTISLLVAVVAMLSKQWLHAYGAHLPKNPYEQSLRRQYRYDGARRWHLSGIIGMLPTLLHLSLGLFLVGLVQFLWAIHRSTGAITLVVVCIGTFFYCASIFLPIRFPDCPYRTPIASELGPHLRSINLIVRRGIGSLHRYLSSITTSASDKQGYERSQSRRRYEGTPFAEESLHVKKDEVRLGVHALTWLLSISRNTESIDVAAQAIAGLKKTSVDDLLKAGAHRIVCDRFVATYDRRSILFSEDSKPTEIENVQASVARYCRAIVQLLGGLEHPEQWDDLDRNNFSEGLEDLIKQRGLFDHVTEMAMRCAVLTYSIAKAQATSRSKTQIKEWNSDSTSDAGSDLDLDLERKWRREHLFEVFYIMKQLVSDHDHMPLSLATLRLFFGTLATCFRQLNPLAEAKSQLTKKAIPVLIELLPFTTCSDAVLSEMSISCLVHCGKTEEPSLRFTLENLFDENHRIFLSLWAIFKSRDRLQLSPKHVELIVRKFVRVGDTPNVLGATYLWTLPSLRKAPLDLGRYLSTAREALLKEHLQSALPILCREDIMNMDEFSASPVDNQEEYIKIVTRLLAWALADDAVDIQVIVANGFSILVRNMQSNLPGVATSCTTSVQRVLKKLVDTEPPTDWIKLDEENNLFTTLTPLIDSHRFTREDLVAWSGALLFIKTASAQFETLITGKSWLPRLGARREDAYTALLEVLRVAFNRLNGDKAMEGGAMNDPQVQQLEKALQEVDRSKPEKAKEEGPPAGRGLLATILGIQKPTPAIPTEEADREKAKETLQPEGSQAQQRESQLSHPLSPVGRLRSDTSKGDLQRDIPQIQGRQASRTRTASPADRRQAENAKLPYSLSPVDRPNADKGSYSGRSEYSQVQRKDGRPDDRRVQLQGTPRTQTVPPKEPNRPRAYTLPPKMEFRNNGSNGRADDLHVQRQEPSHIRPLSPIDRPKDGRSDDLPIQRRNDRSRAYTLPPADVLKDGRVDNPHVQQREATRSHTAQPLDLPRDGRSDSQRRETSQTRPLSPMDRPKDVRFDDPNVPRRDNKPRSYTLPLADLTKDGRADDLHIQQRDTTHSRALPPADQPRDGRSDAPHVQRREKSQTRPLSPIDRPKDGPSDYPHVTRPRAYTLPPADLAKDGRADDLHMQRRETPRSNTLPTANLLNADRLDDAHEQRQDAPRTRTLSPDDRQMVDNAKDTGQSADPHVQRREPPRSQTLPLTDLPKDGRAANPHVPRRDPPRSQTLPQTDHRDGGRSEDPYAQRRDIPRSRTLSPVAEDHPKADQTKDTRLNDPQPQRRETSR